MFHNYKCTYFSEHLLISAFVSTCNNSHTCTFNLLERCFSILLFIFTCLFLPFLYNHKCKKRQISITNSIKWNQEFFYIIQLVSQVNYSSNIVFSNKLFHFSYKILNAPSKKIMFSRNFCHLFSVLFCDSDFFFSRDHSLKGGFTF